MFDDRQTAEKIQATNNAGKQRALGRQVRGFDDDVWAQHRVEIVKQANRAKFGQNKGLRRKLIQTGNH